MKIFLNTEDLNNPTIEITPESWKSLEILESVGSYYDTHTGYVYPIQVKKGEYQRHLEPDLDAAVHITDVTEEFIESLSKEDYNKINNHFNDLL
jgi:hypothetical protein